MFYIKLKNILALKHTVHILHGKFLHNQIPLLYFFYSPKKTDLWAQNS